MPPMWGKKVLNHLAHISIALLSCFYTAAYLQVLVNII